MDSQKRILEVWGHILGDDRVHSPKHEIQQPTEFFGIGGTSLQLIQTATELINSFQTDISVMDLSREIASNPWQHLFSKMMLALLRSRRA